MTPFYMPPADPKRGCDIPDGTPNGEAKVMEFVHTCLQPIVLGKATEDKREKWYALDLAACDMSRKKLERSPYFKLVRGEIRSKGWKIAFKPWPKHTKVPFSEEFHTEEVAALVIFAPV